MRSGALALAGVLAWLGGCDSHSTPDRSSVEATAAAVLEALEAPDYAALAALAHPREGVRFSPFASVETESDVVLSAERIAAAGDDEEVLVWGAHDGTGRPIRLRIVDYFERFVFDTDYTSTTEVAHDRRQGRGNSLDNSREVYPDARIVEYHVPGHLPALEGLDWRSLRLVIGRHDGEWYLVGVIHDEWTI